MTKYIVYATDKDGYVTQIGEYVSVCDISIRTSLFQDGTEITIEEEIRIAMTLKEHYAMQDNIEEEAV